MAFTGTLYEGDGVIHTMPAIAGVQARARNAADTRQAGAGEGAQLGRAQLRAWTSLFNAIGGAIKSAVEWVEKKSRDAHYRQVEGYLSQATDHADLERRLRNLERTSGFMID